MKLRQSKFYGWIAAILIATEVLFTVASVSPGQLPQAISSSKYLSKTNNFSDNTSGNENLLVAQPAYPLKASANRRYLMDQNNQPYLLVGDAAWSLIVQLTRQDVDYYLSNRQQKGFNTVLVNLIDHQFATNAPRDIYGDPPFSGKPFVTPNEAYFAQADYVISAAAQRGINVLLAPLYLGYNCGSEGWCGEVQAASQADMTAWGQYVGNRYKNYPNLIWVIGGDVDPTQYSGVQNKVNAFVNGLKQNDGVHLITAHNGRGEMAVSPWSGASWLNVNNIYTNKQTYPLAQTAYTTNPTLPFFNIEAYYENEHSMTQQQLRAEGYWTYLSGGFGYVFGNCPVWNLGGAAGWCDNNSIAWKSALDQPGSVNVSYMRTLFASRPWQNLEPDWNHTVFVSGYGTFGNSNYATGSRTADGKLGMIYLPIGTTISVDMSKFSGMLTAIWYDPTNGTYLNISGSPFTNSGTKQFTPPSRNNAGDRDWVLVLEVNSNTMPTSTPTKTPTGILPTNTPASTPTPLTGTINIGETNVLSMDDSGKGNRLLAQQITLSQTATIQSLSFYVSSAAGRLRLGIYDDANGKPRKLRTQTTAFTPVVGWNTRVVNNQVSLPAGTYWLAFLPESNNLHFRNEMTGTTMFYSYNFGAMPSSFSTSPSSGAYHYSLYATFIQ